MKTGAVSKNDSVGLELLKTARQQMLAHMGQLSFK